MHKCNSFMAIRRRGSDYSVYFANENFDDCFLFLLLHYCIACKLLAKGHWRHQSQILKIYVSAVVVVTVVTNFDDASTLL